jgi:hypothetical protein
VTLGAEITRSIRGAVRIALLDPDAPSWFNLTIQGFWRSFLAPLLLAPFYLAIMLQDAAYEAPDATEPGGSIAARMLVFAVGSIAFPLLMIPIARMLRLGGAYVSYIIMWNWSAVPQAAVMIPAIAALDLMAERTAGLFFMFATVTVLFYGYLVARAGLRCAPFTAAGIVALDLVLSLLVNAAFRSLLA